MTCYFKNKDILIIVKTTGEPVISDGSVYIQVD